MGKQEIAAALKSARVYRDMTQADAAKATNLTYQAISNYERGANRVDSITLDKLCTLYSISVPSVLDCKFWEPDNLALFSHANSDTERYKIFSDLGPCPQFICQYNDIYLDYVSTRSEKDLTHVEREVLSMLHQLSEDQQRSFLDYLKFLLSNQSP